jgi:hypothetical protein
MKILRLQNEFWHSWKPLSHVFLMGNLLGCSLDKSIWVVMWHIIFFTKSGFAVICMYISNSISFYIQIFSLLFLFFNSMQGVWSLAELQLYRILQYQRGVSLPGWQVCIVQVPTLQSLIVCLHVKIVFTFYPNKD